jgi:hypothetical protein
LYNLLIFSFRFLMIAFTRGADSRSLSRNDIRDAGRPRDTGGAERLISEKRTVSANRASSSKS